MRAPHITLVKPGQDRKVIQGAGDVYYYCATGQETDSQYFFVESMVPPGGGPPPHVQTREEEAFYILEGTITFYAEGKETHATPGTFLNVPKGVRHRFRNNTDKPARMIFMFSPAGIESMFEEMAGRESDFAAHPQGVLFALNEVGKNYGVEFFAEDESA